MGYKKKNLKYDRFCIDEVLQYIKDNKKMLKKSYKKFLKKEMKKDE